MSKRWNNAHKYVEHDSGREYGEYLVRRIFDAAEELFNGGYGDIRIETEVDGNSNAEVCIYRTVINENLEEEDVLQDTFVLWRTYPTKMRGTWNVARLCGTQEPEIGYVTAGYLKQEIRNCAREFHFSLYKKNLEFLKDIFRFVL
jgi:hypothetical protein